MKVIAILTLVFGSLMAVGQVNNIRQDGTELLPQCKTAVRIMDKVEETTTGSPYVVASYCLGLVTGVSDTLSDMLTMCDSDATYGQRVRVVVKYLEEHPEKLNLRATLLVKLAILQAFDCKTK